MTITTFSASINEYQFIQLWIVPEQRICENDARWRFRATAFGLNATMSGVFSDNCDDPGVTSIMARTRLRTSDSPAGLPYMIVGGLLLLVLAYALMTAFYTVPADSQAVVLRFGKVIGTVDPGLHWKLPLGIDRQYTVQVRRQLKQEFGFGTPGSTNPWQASEESVQDEEKSLVTGDLNAALVEWVVQYRIDDPKQYLFAVGSGPHAAAPRESVMREVVGDRTVDEVITIGRQEIESQAC